MLHRVDVGAVWACICVGACLGRPVRYYRISAVGQCPHKTRITAAPEPWPNSTLRKFDLGNALEDFVLDDFLSRYNYDSSQRQVKVSFIFDDMLFVGHLDMIAKADHVAIIDAKVVSAFAFNKYRDGSQDRTIQSYKAQLGGYMLATGADKACLAVRNKDTRGEACVWEDAYIWFDREECVDAFTAAVTALKYDITEHVEPWECRYCRVAYACDIRKEEPPLEGKAWDLLREWIDTGDNAAKEAARDLLNDMGPDERQPFFKHNNVALKLSWKGGRVTIRRMR